MRTLFWLICAGALAIGLLFGALNPQPVTVDLYFHGFAAPLGGVLLFAVLGGALLGGGCVWLVRVLPLRARLRRSQRALDARTPVGGDRPGDADAP